MGKIYGIPDDKQSTILASRTFSEREAAKKSGFSPAQLRELLLAGKIRHTAPGEKSAGYIFLTYKDENQKVQEGLAAADEETKKEGGPSGEGR
jgi:hypothetical protein